MARKRESGLPVFLRSRFSTTGAPAPAARLRNPSKFPCVPNRRSVSVPAPSDPDVPWRGAGHCLAPLSPGVLPLPQAPLGPVVRAAFAWRLKWHRQNRNETDDHSSQILPAGTPAMVRARIEIDRRSFRSRPRRHVITPTGGWMWSSSHFSNGCLQTTRFIHETILTFGIFTCHFFSPDGRPSRFSCQRLFSA